MPRNERLGHGIDVGFPILDKRPLKRPEVVTVGMKTEKISSYPTLGKTITAGTPFYPVRLASFTIADEAVSLYTGDTRTFKAGDSTMLALQAMVRKIVANATEDELAAFTKAINSFNDDPSNHGDARRGYIYKKQTIQADPLTLQIARMNRQEYPDIQYTGNQWHKKDLTSDGHVRHHLVLPANTAVGNLTELTQLVTNRQQTTERMLSEIDTPREKESPPQQPRRENTSTGDPFNDLFTSLFGPSKRRGSPKNEDSDERRDNRSGLPSSAEVIKREPVKSTRKLSDQRGMSAQAMGMARTLVEQIKAYGDPNSPYVQFGGSVDAGFTLSGPTGTGKTSLVEAIAGEVGGYVAEFLGTDIMVPWQHQSGRNLAEILEETGRKFFKKHKNETLFIVINEADAMFPDRKGLKGSGGEDAKSEYVSAALPLIERLRKDNPKGRVVLCFTTNLQIDPAMQRRIGQNIEVNIPDTNGRAEIFSKYLADCLKRAKGNPTILPADLRQAVQAYEEQFAAHASAEALHPLIANLVRVLMPVLKVCEENKLAGGDIEEIVNRAYNRYLLDRTKKGNDNKPMTVEEYLVPMAQSWKPNNGSSRRVGFGN